MTFEERKASRETEHRLRRKVARDYGDPPEYPEEPVRVSEVADLLDQRWEWLNQYGEVWPVHEMDVKWADNALGWMRRRASVLRRELRIAVGGNAPSREDDVEWVERTPLYRAVERRAAGGVLR